jgi:PAS domain S-box-containing protein
VSREPDSVRFAVPWEAIVASASDAIITVDGGQRILLFNASAERMFGCSRADAIGTPLERFIPLIAGPAGAGLPRRCADRGAAAPDAALTARRADGSQFAIEAEISEATIDGRTLYTAIVRDVSERQRAEAMHARLAAIVASSEDAIVAKDLDGTITDWNAGAERIFGYAREEALGRPITMLLPPERQAEEAHILATLRRGERIEHFDTVRVRKDGTAIPVWISVSPIKDATGRVVGAAKIARDVSERKRLEAEREGLLANERAARAEAEKANRAKDEFLSIVSHELRTPLAAILGWVSVLQQGKLSPERAARALKTIERSGRMQSALIEDLLDVSRMTSGRLRLTMQPTSLRAVTHAAVEASRPEAVAAGVRLSAILDTDAHVAGDEIRLQQVVSNLLDNAIKFTPPEGRVEVRLERTDAEARIIVRDTGRGIAAEFLPQVFEPFRQAEDVRSRKKGGLGLGLAIVRQLVEQHGGRVAVESPGEGLGSTVEVALPVLADAVGSPGRPDSAPRLDGLRVLIVEDDDDARDALRAILEESGALVTMAASTTAARARLMTDDPDVLVSNIRLSSDDGYALMREVRRTDRLRGVPVVAISPRAAEDVSARALAAGFQAHFAKPFDPDALVEAIAVLACRHQS